MIKKYIYFLNQKYLRKNCLKQINYFFLQQKPKKNILLSSRRNYCVPNCVSVLM